MIPRFSPNYDGSDMLQALLPTPQGVVQKFEKAFAIRAGHSTAIAFKYGRSGVYFLLKALGAQNKKVIMPSYTCVVVAHAVTLSGNIPVFLDNRPGGFQPDPMAYLDAINDETVMIIPTHLFGLAEETAALYHTVKTKYPHVFVLQDCAHGFFCEDDTGLCVTQYGDGAMFGMNISKLINSIRGGMLTLKDEALAQQIRHIWQMERMKKFENSILSGLKARAYVLAATLAFTPLGYQVVYWLSTHTALLSSETDYYRPEQIDLPADFKDPLLPIEAAIGLKSLAKYADRIAQRKAIAQAYITWLQPHAERFSITLPNYQPGNTWSHFPILVPAAVRDYVRQVLMKAFNIQVGVIVDYAVDALPAYRQWNSLPHATATVHQILNLPLTFSESLLPVPQTDQFIQKICTCIINTIEKVP